MSLDPSLVRTKFPALASGAVFLDNPAGTQVPEQVLDRMAAYLRANNANVGGAFQTSIDSDALIADARLAMASFLNASRPEEIVFGANMTSLTLAISRSLARELQSGDEILVTRLDHDANIAPWQWIASERGCSLRWLDFDVEDCTLRMDQLDALLGPRTRIVAVGYASNAVGTINPVAEIVARARDAGALTFVDAVQYAPHRLIDVAALGCDFLAISAYKFFAPHVGVLYGKHKHLERLTAYKVRPAPDLPPGKFETGTQNHEGIAGLLGALEYLAWIGMAFGDETTPAETPYAHSRQELQAAMAAIQTYEQDLARSLVEQLVQVDGVKIHGITDGNHLHQRVPTFSFTIEGRHPRAIAEHLGQHNVYVWDGNYYALAVTERLGLEADGGMVRVGLVHYNTVEEIERFVTALHELV